MPTRTQLKRQIKDAIIVSLPMRVSVHHINLDEMAEKILITISTNCIIIDAKTQESITDE